MSALARLLGDLSEALQQSRPQILPALRVPAGASARARLDIYCEGYFARLCETLRADYPAFALQLGEDFPALALAYSRTHPSRHPDLRHFGARFPDFLASGAIGPARRWRVQLARLERACSEAFDAADRVPLDADGLGALLAEGSAELGLVLHPSVRRLRLSWNVAALRADALQGRLLSPTRETPADWLVWRQGQRLHLRRLDGEEARLVRRLERGWSVSGLLMRIWRLHPSSAAGTQAFARQMEAWVRTGLVCAVPDTDSLPVR
ncbi:DNA-binding domain-containing protein [Niveibacterium sp. SC-1]|uniref:DNA-binding domain-containing protein n=1 Tax=Niveibacterium sp. SC-1 TaxID=3135646 RepID=UPI00311F486C